MLLLFWLVLGTVIVVVGLVLTTALANVWWMVPFVPTPQVLVKRMVAMADLRPKQRVYDLGAGDARLIIKAERMCPGIHATGFEVAPIAWMLGKLRIILSQSAVDWRFHSFMSADLSDADVIFLYLSPEFMVTLADKFSRELRPGTRIISHAFTFKDRASDAVESIPAALGGMHKAYLYVWK